MSATIPQSATCIAIFERQPYWGPELRRHFVDHDILVRECRSLRDVVPAVEGIANSLMLLDFDAAPDDCLRWLATQFSVPWDVPRIVVASKEYGDLEGLIRESGAIFVHDEVPRTALANLCRRLLRPPKPPLVAAVRGE